MGLRPRVAIGVAFGAIDARFASRAGLPHGGRPAAATKLHAQVPVSVVGSRDRHLILSACRARIGARGCTCGGPLTLSGLDAIPWSKLKTVDGKATRAPAILRGLASGDPKASATGVAWLFAQVLHQSTPAPSAAAFVPFLIELVAQPTQPARWQLLALLGDLACGGDHVPYLMTGYTGADPLQVAVAAGRDCYAKVLGGRAAPARAAAAFALAWLPTHAASSRKDLTARLTKEKDPTARASMLMALAVLGDAKPATAALAAAEPVVQGAAVFALARRGALSAKAKRVAAGLVTAGGVEALCWQRGQLGALVLRAVLHASVRDDDAVFLASLMFSGVGHVVTPRVLELMFPGPIAPAALRERERAVLDQVTASPAHVGQLKAFWEARGLPPQAGPLRAALGLGALATRMDTVLTVDGVARPFAAHFAEAVAKPRRRAALAAALAKGRGAREVAQYCVESVGLDVPDDGGATIVALLEACGDDLVPVLRELDLYQEVQRPNGDLVIASSVAAPALLVLARRDPTLPGTRLQAMINTISLARDIDVERSGPMAVEILRALRPAQRVAILAHLHRATPAWVTRGKLLFEQLMVESPAPELTACLLQRVKELADDFAYGRKYGGSLFGERHPQAKLKAMSPGEHPLTATLTEPIEAYAAAAKAPALTKALVKFRAM